MKRETPAEHRARRNHTYSLRWPERRRRLENVISRYLFFERSELTNHLWARVDGMRYRNLRRTARAPEPKFIPKLECSIAMVKRAYS